MEKTKWDHRFIELAKLVSSWSKDPSAGIGSVIVDQKNRVVSLGFNGYARGVKDEGMDNREEKLYRTIHAEQNALAFANQSVEGFTLYCTHCPCSQCASMIIQRGIKKIVFPNKMEKGFTERWQHQINISLELFKESGIIIKQIS